MKVTETHDRDEWDDSEYINMDLTAKVHHNTNNGGDEPNRHAVVLGDNVFIFQAEQ